MTKFILFVVTLLSFSHHLYAVDYNSKTPANVCEEIAKDLYSANLPLTCVDLALHGTFTNGKAVNTCYRLAKRNLSESALYCLQYINGKEFDQNVADVCTANVDNNYGRETLKCLEKTAGKFYHQSLVATCVNLAESSRPNASLTCLNKILR